MLKYKGALLKKPKKLNSRILVTEQGTDLKIEIWSIDTKPTFVGTFMNKLKECSGRNGLDVEY